MQTQTVNALSYCFNLLVFVFNNKEAGDKIKSIYLFGSAVRGELHKQSDIDLFIECELEHEERVKRLVDSGMVKFQASRDFQKWKNWHFTFPFAVHLGKLSEWDLKLSIASEGIIIYNKSINLNDAKRMVLFIIDYPKSKNGYIKVRRALFGRDEKQFKPGGIIQKLTGRKISAHVFIIPKEEQVKMINFLSREKIEFSMKEINLLES